MFQMLGLLIAWRIFPFIVGPLFALILKAVHPSLGYSSLIGSSNTGCYSVLRGSTSVRRRFSREFAKVQVSERPAEPAEPCRTR